MSSVETAVAQWAAANPKIKRAWIVGELEVAVEIQPVADSEETIAVWLAKGEQWRAELRQRIDPTLELEWFDPIATSRSSARRSATIKRWCLNAKLRPGGGP